MISPKRLAYLLIVLIALQSVTVVAEDDHQAHQNGDQHLQLDKDHEHQDPAETVSDDVSTAIAQGGDLDCHHCCHCHSPTQLEFLSNSNNFNYARIFGLPSDYLFNYISKPLSPALRPPIV
ncbi:MAG: hypothetical protein L3J22_11450 [Xanthomonadales bacterium]|nr:hypothetical protein [Xanthomonadales bacterium]